MKFCSPLGLGGSIGLSPSPVAQSILIPLNCVQLHLPVKKFIVESQSLSFSKFMKRGSR